MTVSGTISPTRSDGLCSLMRFNVRTVMSNVCFQNWHYLTSNQDKHATLISLNTGKMWNALMCHFDWAHNLQLLPRQLLVFTVGSVENGTGGYAYLRLSLDLYQWWRYDTRSGNGSVSNPKCHLEQLKQCLAHLTQNPMFKHLRIYRSRYRYKLTRHLLPVLSQQSAWSTVKSINHQLQLLEKHHVFTEVPTVWPFHVFFSWYFRTQQDEMESSTISQFLVAKWAAFITVRFSRAIIEFGVARQYFQWTRYILSR